MLSAYCCPTNDNLPQLIVAVSSFMRHNPGVPVVAYFNKGTDVEALEAMGVEAVCVIGSHLMISGLDDLMLRRPDVTRAVHIGATTLTQDSLSDMAGVPMDGLPIGAASVYMFPHDEVGPDCYCQADPELFNARRQVNERYFDTDFLLFNLEQCRRQQDRSIALRYCMSRARTEQEFLNQVFGESDFLNMPGNLNVAPEHTIHLDLNPFKLARHRLELENARVIRFPGDVVPWRPIKNVDRASIQLPMKQYLAAAECVVSLLPPEFVKTIEANSKLLNDYIGPVADVLAEAHSIAMRNA